MADTKREPCRILHEMRTNEITRLIGVRFHLERNLHEALHLLYLVVEDPEIYVPEALEADIEALFARGDALYLTPDEVARLPKQEEA